jgi:hypothetical protein
LADRHIRKSTPDRKFNSVGTLSGIALLLLLFFGSQVSAAEQYWEYTVRPGDNIWNLTKTHCTSVRYWKRIQKLNNIDLDREIPPGTRLRFPLSILKHQPATAIVARLQGSAELLRAGESNTVPLQAGATLRSGDRIMTGADSNLTLQFADDSRLLVLADSEVLMDSLSAWGTTGMVDTSIRLQGGRVDTRVKPSRGPGSRYQIITPAAVAAVRGTDFRVSAETGKPVMRSEVTEGTVGVGDAGKSTRVKAGFGLVAEAGKVPEKPRKLLPAADLSRLPGKQRQLPLNFSWPAVSGARSYRFQVAPNADFDILLVDETTEQAAASWKALPDGHYALRIRAIDDVALEGINSVHLFEVDARPFPPVTASPPDTAVIREADPVFSWSVSGDNSTYRIQVARDADFSELVNDRKTGAAKYKQETPLEPDTYHWRVAGIDHNGKQGPYGAVQSFTYRQPLAAPLLRQPVVSHTRLLLAWQAVDDAESYQLQLATDPYFQDVRVNVNSQTLQVEIPRPPSQVYFFRARAINPAGEPGPFSTPLKVYVPPLYPWWPLVLAVPLLLVL